MFDLVPPHQHISSTAAVFDKAHTTTNIYLRQSNAAPTHAVIQLVEVSPPPRRIASVIRDASLASSSYESGSSYYSSSYDSEGMDLDEDEEDEEADGESYCSSDDEVQQQQLDQQEPEPAPAITSEDQEAFARRMKRILVWRELTVSASSDISSTPTPASSTSQLLLPLAPTSLKRSASSVADECDAPSSKRSRCGAPSSVASDACPPSVSFSTSSSASSSSAPISIASSLRRSISPAELSLPACTACDAFFPTVDAFRAHAHPSREACGAAVEYAFEH